MLLAPMVMSCKKLIYCYFKVWFHQEAEIKENLKQIQKQTSTPTSRKVINVRELKSFSKYPLSDLML